MLDPQARNADIYTDFSGLNALKTEAHSHKKGALNQVAKQFEALLISQMLKAMRQSNEVFAKGTYLDSQNGKLYQEMYDHQLSLSLSQHQGIGLAKVLERQLSQQIDGGAKAQDSAHPLYSSIRDYPRSLPPISPDLPGHYGKVSKLLDQKDGPSQGARGNQNGASTDGPGAFSSPEEFVRRLSPVARRIGEKTGISPKLLLAQAALETGWGQHMIVSSKGRNSHNLFGIKAGEGWQGDRVSVTTTEYRDGRPMKEVAPFRAYPSYSASFQDYASFLQSNPRYQSVLQQAGNPAAFTQSLQDSGYATDPDYGKKIQDIMQRSPIESALDVQRLGLTPDAGGE